MKMSRRQMAGGACMLGGTVAYLWLMAAFLVPTAQELSAGLGVPSPEPVAWIGLTAVALLVALGVDRAFSRKR